MNQVRHVFRKDLRRLRWALVAWIAVVIARLVLKTVGTELSFGTLAPQLVIANVADLLLFSEILVLALIVSVLVHDEPLVGADAFWLTRPIGRSALLSAKLSFAAVFLVAVPMACEALAIAAIAGGLRTASIAGLAYAFSQTLWVSLLLALAAVTPSLMRFLMTLVATVAAVAVGLTLLVTLFLLTASIDEAGYTESVLVDGTFGVVVTLMITCAALVSIAYQYRHRRAGRAVAIGIAGIVAAVVISGYWPWRFGLPAEPDPGAWAQDAARSPAVLDSAAAPRTSDEFAMDQASSRKYVAAPVRLAGIPPAYSADRLGTKTRIEFPDGASLESAQARDVGFHMAAPEPSPRTARLQSALGNLRLTSRQDEQWSSWPVLLSITGQEYERYGSVPGRLTASIHFFLYQSKQMGTIPLAAHASLQDGPRFEVLRVLRRPDGCSVLVRRIGVGALTRPSPPKEYDFVLRNAARGEAILGQRQPLSAPGPRVANVFIPGGFSLESASPGFGSYVVDEVAEFPPRGAPPVAPLIDAAWLDGADIVVIETAYAGRVRRTLTVDGFRMR